VRQSLGLIWAVVPHRLEAHRQHRPPHRKSIVRPLDRSRGRLYIGRSDRECADFGLTIIDLWQSKQGLGTHRSGTAFVCTRTETTWLSLSTSSGTAFVCKATRTQGVSEANARQSGTAFVCKATRTKLTDDTARVLSGTAFVCKATRTPSRQSVA